MSSLESPAVESGVTEREGIARLTRVAKVAPPTQSTGLMPPPRPRSGDRSQSSTALPRTVLEGPTGIAKLTPKAAAVAAATTGLAGDMHIPNGMMFIMGILSMMLACG